MGILSLPGWAHNNKIIRGAANLFNVRSYNHHYPCQSHLLSPFEWSVHKCRDVTPKVLKKRQMLTSLTLWFLESDQPLVWDFCTDGMVWFLDLTPALVFESCFTVWHSFWKLKIAFWTDEMMQVSCGRIQWTGGTWSRFKSFQFT